MMNTSVAVTLTIMAVVDAEFPAKEHIDDIVSNAQTTFSACDIKVVNVEVDDQPHSSVVTFTNES